MENENERTYPRWPIYRTGITFNIARNEDRTIEGCHYLFIEEDLHTGEIYYNDWYGISNTMAEFRNCDRRILAWALIPDPKNVMKYLRNWKMLKESEKGADHENG